MKTSAIFFLTVLLELPAILAFPPGGTGPAESLASYDWSRLRQKAYLKASNTDSGDSVFSVAVSGETIAVGALGEDSGASGVNGDQSDNSVPDSGAVYIFVRSGTNWVQQAYLKASNCGASDNFGEALDLSGDTLVVGAFLEDSAAVGVNGNQQDDSATNSGAAYVFVRNGTNWTQQAYLKASNSEAHDWFGSEISISGDTVVIAAHQEDSSATGINGNESGNAAPDSGAAYVFVRNGTNWTQQAYLKASNTGADDAFGEAVAISGDTILVSAHQEDSNSSGVNGNQSNNSATEAGAAYVFVRNGTNWMQQAYLKASNTGAGDRFGFFAGLSGETAVVGALREDSMATGVNGDQNNENSTDSGAAYVFVREGDSWTQQAYLKASNTSGGDRFGRAVAIQGDWIIVGAPLQDTDANGVMSDDTFNSGAAYLFSRTGTNWIQRAFLKPSNTGRADTFGMKVALSDNLILVSSISEDSSATGANGDQMNDDAPDSGAAYLFTVPLEHEWHVPDDFPTLQSAIDASSSGDTIRIAPGDYFEQVIISGKTNLTLVGTPAEGETRVVLHATEGMAQTLQPFSSALAVLGIVKSSVAVQGLTISGDHLASGTLPVLAGIFYLGSSGSVENCIIRGFRGSTVGTFAYGRGLNVWNGVSVGTPIVMLTVASTTFEDNMVSIVLAGDDRLYPDLLRTKFTLEQNMVTGFGPIETAVDGIIIYNGAEGIVRNNVIQNHAYTGPGEAFSSGILAKDGFNRAYRPLRPLLFEKNIFRNNDDHLVLVHANGSQVAENSFDGSGPNGPRWGALSLSGRDVRVVDNNFTDTSYGIFLFGNDHYFEGWPHVGSATNPYLSSNWFLNVSQLVRTNQLVVGVQEQGTRTAPFQPEFRSINREDSLFTFNLRGWHGESIVLEYSRDFSEWTPVLTNRPTAPIWESAVPTSTEPARFFRIRRE